MSPKAKNYLIVLLAASTISASLLAWNQSRRLSSLQSDLLKAAASAAAVKPKSAPVAAAFTKTASVATDTESAAPATEEGAQSRQRNNRPNFAALMANPEFAKAISIQQRAALDNRYAALFKQLNLSPEQLEKFKSLLLERQSARMDVMTAARENGLNPRENRDEINKLVSDAQAEVDANIKNSLGEGVYSQYQNYDSTQAQRGLVSQLDQRLSYSSTPLNSTQTNFLVSALSASGATESADQGGGGPGNWVGSRSSVTITDAVIQQAQSVLTPDQVAALKQLQTEQQAQQKVRELMRNGGGTQTARPAGN